MVIYSHGLTTNSLKSSLTFLCKQIGNITIYRRIGTPPGNSLLSDVWVEETILCLKEAH